MTYPDKLEKYISTGRAEDKPDSFDFWKWINNYDPKEDGLQFVRHDLDWEVWEKRRRYLGVNMPIVFRIRPQYGVCYVTGSISNDDIQFAAIIAAKVKDQCQVRGTMAEFTPADRLDQFDRFCKKNGA